MLIHLYAVYAWGDEGKADAEAPFADEFANGHANGHPNGYSRVDRRVRDAEEFELEGLDSDEEENAALANKERPRVALP